VRHDARIGIGLGLVIVLAGCSTQSPQPKATSVMTPAESVTTLYGFYSKTVDHLGTSGWQALPPEPTVLGIPPDDCSLPDGTTGVNYSDVLLGPGTVDAAASAEKVQTYWKSQGLTAKTSRSSNANDTKITVDAADDELKAQYKVDAQGASISLVTTCVAGDSSKLIEAIRQHRARPSPQPSTPAT
jgi:hypothetical protein